MQKLSDQSKDISQENIRKIEEIFPNCVTETYDQDGNLVRSIDFDILRQDLSDHVVEGPKERYQFNWPGKREAILLANAPTTNTLRPLPEKSVDFENAKNVYIEGDNLEALKILRETYMGKIKMIYIDPPYNTGNDFVYKDNFKQSTEDYLKSSGDIDEEGNRMEVNGESNGRFHSDWLNMMYPRLVLARDLLTDDGAIFISIDENEVTNLKNLCNTVFGEKNFIDTLHWKKKKQPSFLAKHTAKVMEYVVVYAKQSNFLGKLSIETISDSTKKVINIANPCSLRHLKEGLRVKLNGDGVIKAGRYLNKTMYVEYLSDVRYKNGRTIDSVDVNAQFLDSQSNIDDFIKDDLLFITSNLGLRRDVSDEEKNKQKAITDLLLSEYGDNQESDKEQRELFGNKYFDYSKPVDLIKNLIKSNEKEDSYIMDFFSGSATTGESVYKLNLETDKNLKFILVQLPEITDSSSEAFKEGYKTICDIGEERLRRAGEKIKDSNPLTSRNLDVGFRVFKIDSSNMKDILSTPKETQLSLLENAESAIKPGRNTLDLVTQVMLQLGITLDADIKIGKSAGSGQFYVVNGNDLVCCFDKNISESSIEEMARMQPLNVAFRDDSFASDQDEVNCEQIFKTLSPITGKNIFVL